MKKIFTSDHLLHHATESDVKTFTKALIARFPVPEECSPDKSELQLMFLKQGEGENLEEYYRRAETLLHHIGGVDRKESPLTDNEETSLKRVLVQFVHGIHDKDTRENALQFWQNRTILVGTTPPGLGEVFQFAKCVFDKSAFLKETFEAAYDKDHVRPDDLNLLLKESANQSVIANSEKEPTNPTSDANVCPPVFQGKARLVNISPTKKKSVTAPPLKTKTLTVPKTFSAGTSLSDVAEEEYDPSLFEDPRDSDPKTLRSKFSNSSIYSSYFVPPSRPKNKASSETVCLDTAAEDDDDLTIRAPTVPTHARSSSGSGQPPSCSSQSVRSVRFAEDENSGAPSPDAAEEGHNEDLFGVPRGTLRASRPSISSQSPYEDDYEGDDDMSSEDPDATTPTLLSSSASHFAGFSGKFGFSIDRCSARDLSTDVGEEYISRQEGAKGPAPALPSPAFSSSSSSPSGRSIEPVRVTLTSSVRDFAERPATPSTPRPNTISRSTSTPSISGRPMGSFSHASGSAHSLGSDILSTVASQKARRGTYFSNLRTDSDSDLSATLSNQSVPPSEMAGPTPPPRTSSHAARAGSAKGATTERFRDV